MEEPKTDPIAKSLKNLDEKKEEKLLSSPSPQSET